MYASHFGLMSRPFAETVDPAAYVSLPSRDSALRRLRYGLEQGRGPALLSGPPGTGKTLLAAELARDRGGPTLHLTFPAMSAAELIAFIAEELAAPPAAGPGLAGSLRRLRTALAAASARGERLLLIVDEAHLLANHDAFEAIRLLTNFHTGGQYDLDLLLVADPQITLDLPTSLADRLAARCFLNPLTRAETATYIDGRLRIAGANESLFSPESIAALHRAADGLPRRLNRLADLALLIAYAQNHPRPDADSITLAIRELALDPPLAA